MTITREQHMNLATTTQAIRIHQSGGTSQLRWETLSIGRPGPGEIRLEQTAIGLNFIDVYMRSGLYPLPELPATIGVEAAGTVVAIGEGVDNLAVGDHVAYCMVPGAYAEQRNIAANKVLKLPNGIEDSTAAAVLLKGLTAHYLLYRSYAVKPGDSILVFAAAGGVGSILCQWANYLGVRVIACAGSQQKCQLAKSAGAHECIDYSSEDVVQRVRDLTGGEGVAASYDSIGQATFETSLNCLRPFGVLVTYGNASGPVEPFSPALLAAKGSLYVTRPSLATHVATRELLEEGADRLFDVIRRGIVDVQINQAYKLSDAARAHQDLESRSTTGSTLLLP